MQISFVVVVVGPLLLASAAEQETELGHNPVSS